MIVQFLVIFGGIIQNAELFFGKLCDKISMIWRTGK